MTKSLTYRQIAGDVYRRIRAGEYAPGAAIPSYRHLALLYGVSMSTAQRAVRVLRELGLAIGRPGRGVFVPQQPALTPNRRGRPQPRGCPPNQPRR